MDVGTILEELRKMTEKDPAVRDRLLASEKAEDPITDFCRYVRQLGFELYEADLVFSGEEMYAQMNRSINGGGENHPTLPGNDDYYAQFMADLKELMD